MRLTLNLLLLLLPRAVLGALPGDEPGFSPVPVHPITTAIAYSNGDEQRNHGTGFVIGERFYTAYHNIHAPAGTAVRRISISGIEVHPLAIDPTHDLAVFELPPTLCAAWCNESTFTTHAFALPGEVTWLSFERAGRTWKRGRVSNLAFKSTPPGSAPGGCEHDLVVEVDQPFLPGSSGGPVFDAASGAVVGLIQGSFESWHGQSTGYYKPAHCIMARLTRP